MMRKNVSPNYSNIDAVNDSLFEVSDKIRELKFKKRIFGGFDELDVWRKLSQIDKEYQNALKIQQEFYDNKIRVLEDKLATAEQE